MRILLATTRFPLPARRGQQVRTVEWLEALAGEHELALICPEGSAAPWFPHAVTWFRYRGGPLAASLGLLHAGLTGRPFQEGLYDTPAARSAVRRAVEGFRPEVLVVQMVRCGWAMDAARSVAPSLPVVFDAIDSMWLHFARRWSESAWFVKPLHRVEAIRCRRREAVLASAAQRSVAVAARDVAAIGNGRGVVIPVAGRPAPDGVARSSAPTVALTGNLGYRPTVTAAVAFADAVWPEIRRRRPDARWILAGARPHRRIQALASRPGIEVLGEVPDLGEVLATAWVAVAPMGTGSGVPMKVLEAWAAGVPVVVHPWSVEGLLDDTRHAVRTAANPREWADRVVGLLEDDVDRRRLADAGRGAWARHYSPDAVRDSVRGLFAGFGVGS
jgi:glycosyltransferase involved in cell wall biosynthesis